MDLGKMSNIAITASRFHFDENVTYSILDRVRYLCRVCKKINNDFTSFHTVGNNVWDNESVSIVAPEGWTYMARIQL